MKYLQLIILILVITATILPISLAGQTETRDYQLLERSIFPDSPETISVSNYFTKVYQVALSAAVILAVLMLVIAGIQYTAAGVSESAKTDAKKRFQEALTGLLLALGSWLILNTINPQLANPSALAPTGGGGVVSPAPATAGPREIDLSQEEAVRARLRAAGITVNNPACARVGQNNCTNVGGFVETLIVKIINLANSCGCDLTVTGGTEWWKHSSVKHKNGQAVDFAFPGPNEFLIREAEESRRSNCPQNNQYQYIVYRHDGLFYTYEPSRCFSHSSGQHWHVNL